MLRNNPLNVPLDKVKNTTQEQHKIEDRPTVEGPHCPGHTCTAMLE